MNKVISWLFTIFLVGAIAIVEAQQPKKVYRIGYLANSTASAQSVRREAEPLIQQRDVWTMMIAGRQWSSWGYQRRAW